MCDMKKNDVSKANIGKVLSFAESAEIAAKTPTRTERRSFDCTIRRAGLAVNIRKAYVKISAKA
jgi:hypothetical protein